MAGAHTDLFEAGVVSQVDDAQLAVVENSVSVEVDGALGVGQHLLADD